MNIFLLCDMRRLPRHMHFKPLFLEKWIIPKCVCRSGNVPYIPQNHTDITSSSTPSLIANSGAMTSCSRVDSHFPRARRACVRTRAQTLPTFLSSLISGETSPLATHTLTHVHTALWSAVSLTDGGGASQRLKMAITLSQWEHIICMQTRNITGIGFSIRATGYICGAKALQQSTMIRRSGALYKMWAAPSYAKRESAS